MSQGKKPLLFLDIDGVLNYEALLREWNPSKLADAIEPSRVRLLNRIVDKTNTPVVLSSSWRRMFGSMEDANAFFRSVGFSFSLLDRTTLLSPAPLQRPCLSWPCGFNGSRGAQIGLWLKANGRSHNDTAVCILDDDWAAIGSSLFPYLVGTSFREGLTPELAEEAIRLLQGESVRRAGFVR